MKIEAVTTPPTPAETKARDLEKAGREFEAIFVRSMLATTPIAGKGDMYGGLAVDAMASAVTQGRGLGLAQLIDESVRKTEQALKNGG